MEHEKAPLKEHTFLRLTGYIGAKYQAKIVMNKMGVFLYILEASLLSR